MSTVAVVDYGSGNLFSVRRALEKCGADVVFVHESAAIGAAERLILPGVGAFADGMAGLRARGLVGALQEFAASGRPMLGICLGMQMLFSKSEEFGEHTGLNIIPGRVVAIPGTGEDGRPHKIPYIGWNTLAAPRDQSWSKVPLLAGVKLGAAVYLVHSFTAVPDEAHHRLADCSYDGRLICAMAGAGNVYGCQFHPEKSAATGLRILESFVRL